MHVTFSWNRVVIAALATLPAVLTASTARAATLQVGPNKTYAAPCAAIGAAADGDTIEIDAAGSYVGDVCGWTKNGLTLRGVNGRPKIDAGGQASGGKATWVIAGNDTTVENVELTGASVPAMNGAGIRQEGANLTVRGCYFHDNEDGILAGDNAASDIVVEKSEFNHNGFGDGYSHNFYINHVKSFTFRESWSHRATEGHLLKSRAAENYVLYNRLTGEDGTDSYELDFPNGGKTYVIGNVIEQGPTTHNPNILIYREEGANANNPSTELYVVNNTFVNDAGGGTFVTIDAGVTTPAILTNNIFFGPGTVTNQASAVIAASCTMDPLFVDAAGFDFHLGVASPCKDAGVDPAMGGSMPLLPTRQYVHPASSEGRTSVGAIDAGAFEVGGGTGGAGSTSSSATGAGTGSATGAGSGAGTGGANGTGGAGANVSSDSGCGCVIASSEERTNEGLVGLGLLGGLALQRRRRKATRERSIG